MSLLKRAAVVVLHPTKCVILLLWINDLLLFPAEARLLRNIHQLINTRYVDECVAQK